MTTTTPSRISVRPSDSVRGWSRAGTNAVGRVPSRDSLAFTYLKLGEIDRAIAEYDSVLRADPEKPFSLYGRGVAKQKKGDVVGAEADMLAARAIRPDIADKFAEMGFQPDGR